MSLTDALLRHAQTLRFADLSPVAVAAASSRSSVTPANPAISAPSAPHSAAIESPIEIPVFTGGRSGKPVT